MAAIANSLQAVLSREQLRTFHLAGPGPDQAVPAGALRPTLLATLKDLPQIETFYPVCVHPEGGARPLRELVAELEHADIIVSAIRAAMNGVPSAPLEETTLAAIDSLVECPKDEIAQLRRLLPANGFLLGFHPDSLALLHAAQLAGARKEQRTAFWEDVRNTAARLRELLLLDEANSPNAVTAESVTASLGSRLGSFFKPDSLAKALQSPRNPSQRMPAVRRSRCEKTLAALAEAIHDAANHPAFWLFHSGIFGTTSAPSAVLLFHGDARFAVDSFSAAMQFCDARLERFTHLLRALRVARLELESSFDPLVHEEMLARFDWQSASAAELLALPPVVVIETADCLGQASLTSFGQLLRSGRPVQTLIVRAGLEPKDLHQYAPDFGSLAVAHRESFVLQSSLAQPWHLLAGLASMAMTLRPAVAVVAAPRDDDEEAAWLEECLLVLSRTVPLFTYNPDRGARWAQRFQLFPQPPQDVTAVHAAAVSRHLRRQFYVVASSDWNSEQMELNMYLEAYVDRPPLAIPYIWVEDGNGREQRALLTRDLANFCIDRRRAWALLEELSEVAKPQPTPDADAGAREGARQALETVLALLQSR